METNQKHITTSQVDASLGLAACKAYADGDFKAAENFLIQILDSEPNNWLARYYLAVCYAKNKQIYAAQRAFRLLYDKSTDQDVRSKACLMLQRINSEIHEGVNKKPIEFGRFNEAPGRIAW
jgi:cytochrome c-type biogenesis protein CcmH/NrfG